MFAELARPFAWFPGEKIDLEYSLLKRLKECGRPCAAPRFVGGEFQLLLGVVGQLSKLLHYPGRIMRIGVT